MGAALAVLVAGPAFLLFAGVTAAAGAPAVTAASVRSAQTPQNEVKFYVVAPPVNGKMEFLFEIAARTLGDGNRFPEIVELNKDRLQPDGGRLTNPESILPGWILQLPDDAAGPGVQTGPLPTVQQAPGNGDKVGFGIEPAGGQPQDGPVSPAPGQASGEDGNFILSLIGAAVIAVLVAVAGVVVAVTRWEASTRRSGVARHARRPAVQKPKKSKPQKQPKLPKDVQTGETAVVADTVVAAESDHTEQPHEEATDLVGATTPALEMAPVVSPAALLAPGLDLPHQPDILHLPDEPDEPDEPELHERDELDEPEPDDPNDLDEPEIDLLEYPALPEPLLPSDLPPPSLVLQTSVPSLSWPAPVDDDRAEEQAEAELELEPDLEPEPEPEPEPELDLELEAEPELDLEPEPEPDLELEPEPAPELSLAIVEQVSFGDDVVQLQITTASPGTSPVTWTPMPYDVPQDGVAYVCLGASDKGCLFVDLGRAPGPVAVGGDLEAAARLVESIAFQLSAALEPGRASVTVIGDIGRSLELGQVDRVSTLKQIVSRGSTAQDGAEPPLELLLCSRDTARDETALAWLTSDRSRRVVPIVIGALPSAPWSLTAGTSQLHGSPATPQEAAGIPS